MSGPMLTPDSAWGVSTREMNEGVWLVPTSQTPEWLATGAEWTLQPLVTSPPADTNALEATESDAGIAVTFWDMDGWLLDMMRLMKV